MQFSSYTLLVVESGVTARAIENCEIPGLEVLPTFGYAWLPERDSNTGKLKAKANPDQSDFRKALKSKAQFANRIILATDSDPSGEFIAQSIYRFLGKDEKICSGNLGTVSPSGVQLLLDSAVPVNQDKASSLERYFRSRNMLVDAVRSAFGQRYSFEEIIALGCVLTQKEFIDFTDETCSLSLKPISPVAREESTRLNTKPAQSDKSIKSNVLYPVINFPVSTAFLPVSENGSYAESQEALNRLFSFFDPEIGSGLISYPRTVATGYYEGTWNRLSSELQKRAGAEGVLTPALRRIISTDEEHEALHVVNSEIEPFDLRPFLKKEALGLYRKLYRNTISSLKYPAGIPLEQLVVCESGNLFYSCDGSVLPGSAVLRPVTTVQQVMQMMLDSGWIKASRIGSAMDQLCRSDLFTVMNTPVNNITINIKQDANNTTAFALKLRSAAIHLKNVLNEDQSAFDNEFRTITQSLITSPQI